MLNPSAGGLSILPSDNELDTNGLDLDPEDLSVLLGADTRGWLEEIPLIRAHYAQFGDRLPLELANELDALEQRLKTARS